jgi:hypothetical protein
MDEKSFQEIEKRLHKRDDDEPDGAAGAAGI